jgi:hypothetical protein
MKNPPVVVRQSISNGSLCRLKIYHMIQPLVLFQQDEIAQATDLSAECRMTWPKSLTRLGGIDCGEHTETKWLQLFM